MKKSLFLMHSKEKIYTKYTEHTGYTMPVRCTRCATAHAAPEGGQQLDNIQNLFTQLLTYEVLPPWLVGAA